MHTGRRRENWEVKYAGLQWIFLTYGTVSVVGDIREATVVGSVYDG